jgi:hypothetical protein
MRATSGIKRKPTKGLANDPKKRFSWWWLSSCRSSYTAESLLHTQVLKGLSLYPVCPSCILRYYHIVQSGRLVAMFHLRGTVIMEPESFSEIVVRFCQTIRHCSPQYSLNQNEKKQVLHIPFQMWCQFKDLEGLGTGCWREHLDRREMKWREIRENYIMSSFKTSTPRQI